MGTGGNSSGVRLAELVATLSLAADMGLGQPVEHAIRSGLVALRMGDEIGLEPEDRAATYWLNLLAWIGCTSDSHELARLFGDDIALRHDRYEIDDKPSAASVAFMLRHAGSGGTMMHRASVSATLLLTGSRVMDRAVTTHCEVAGLLASRLGLADEVRDCLGYVFARWDGKGLPKGAAGEDLPLSARLLHVADIVVAHEQAGGLDEAVSVARERRGTQFDPDLVDVFLDIAPDVFEEMAGVSSWERMIAAEPSLGGPLADDDLDEKLEVLGDFADLKSPYLLGHSRGVAELAVDAAEESGLPDGDVRLVRRAGLIHDLGRIGIPNSIWDKVEPLTNAEVDRIRLHTYYTQRMLQQPAALAEIGAVASGAHERADGSGYHRGVDGPAISSAARLLAVADVVHAMGEARPHRPPHDAAAIARHVRAEAKAGAFAPDAVEAVLASAGHTPRRRRSGPAGLTPREIEVLVLVARGASNRQVAQRLAISPKTAGSHIEHIYVKIGVSSRAAAALFAIQHGLVPDLEPLDV